MSKNEKLIKDFKLYAKSEHGISTLKNEDYAKHIIKNNSRLFTNAYIEPTIVEERQMNMSLISVYSRLFMDRVLILGTEIDSDVNNIVSAQLMYLNSISDEDIQMHINSGGGSVVDGLAILDTMNFISADVSTICRGMCASMASVLLSAGTKGKRYALPHGSIMIHQVSGGTGRAQCSDVQIVAQEMKKTQDTLYKILSENTGKTFEEIARDADRDYWMTSEEAMNYGIIDNIIRKEK
jgi:ATP-dependent Clp protease protease subunit